MFRLTFRRLLLLCAVLTVVATAGLAAAVALGLLDLVDAVFVAFAGLTLMALGVLGLGLRRLDRRVQATLRDQAKLATIQSKTNALTDRYAKSLREVTDLIEEVRGIVGEHRVEMLTVLRELEAERSEAATRGRRRSGGAVTAPRRSPIPAPAPPSEPVMPQSVSGPGGSILYTGDDTVALTFDDGPDPVFTALLLDLLRRHEITATFFVVGKRVHQHQSLVKRIADEGHILANHSWSHRLDLAKIPDGKIADELANTNEVILSAVPEATIEYFRAPGGHFDPKLVALAKAHGMQSIYWSVNPKDWDDEKYGRGPAMVDQIVTTLQRDVKPGSIILSHDYQKPDTVAAYRILLPWLKDNFTIAPLRLGNGHQARQQ